jgi:hypothetical protein
MGRASFFERAQMYHNLGNTWNPKLSSTLHPGPASSGSHQQTHSTFTIFKKKNGLSVGLIDAFPTTGVKGQPVVGCLVTGFSRFVIPYGSIFLT